MSNSKNSYIQFKKRIAVKKMYYYIEPGEKNTYIFIYREEEIYIFTIHEFIEMFLFFVKVCEKKK
jgi:hypothetical protein